MKSNPKYIYKALINSTRYISIIYISIIYINIK